MFDWNLSASHQQYFPLNFSFISQENFKKRIEHTFSQINISEAIFFWELSLSVCLGSLDHIGMVSGGKIHEIFRFKFHKMSILHDVLFKTITIKIKLGSIIW